MGFLDKIFKRKKEDKPQIEDAALSENILDESVFNAESFVYSQNIYDRNLRDVYIFEIQPANTEEKAAQDTAICDLAQGQFIEINEGLLTLGVFAGRCCASVFARHNTISLSYNKQGESFFVEGRVADVTEANKDSQSADTKDETSDIDADTVPVKYIIQVVLCSESKRHRRKYGRIAVEWKVLYKEDNTENDKDIPEEYLTSKTIDISEGGFKGIVNKTIKKDTIIKCVIEIDEENKTEGEIAGKVVRCYRITGERDLFEMTVSFAAMDEQARNFLMGWIEKMQPAAVNAEPRLTISEQGTQAVIELNAPENNGADATYEELCALLDSENIKHGVDYELVRSMADKPHYNLEYVVARCTPPIHGTAAVLKYNVNMNPTFTPKIDEDGMADFKDIGLIHRVNKNEVLAIKTPSTKGEPGISVTGEVIEAIPGEDKPFPAGQNTVINDMDTGLLAAVDGYISIVNGMINVFDTYVVEGDVQYSTGNIDHNGIVIIKGDVRSGFSVYASGDVVVHGTVESATVTAGGALVVHGGCVGEANDIDVKGNVAIKFIDGGLFKIAGTLTSSYIINAEVKCGDTVELAGPGLIRNSHIIAKTAINAKSVGSISAGSDRTVVEVGNDPILLAKYDAISAELEKVEKDLEIVRTNIHTLTMLKYKEELTREKSKMLEGYKLIAMQFTVKQNKLIDKQKILQEQIDMLGYGTVSIEDLAYEGLRVIIGPREYVLRDTVKGARFRRTSQGVEIEGL